MENAAKTEWTALVADAGGLCGLRLVRARGAWSVVASGVWPLAAADAAAPDAPDPWIAALAAAADAMGSRTVSLALPTSQLLVKILALPAVAADDLHSIVQLQMDKISPFPGEELTVGCETLATRGTTLQVLGAALPRAILETWDRRVQAAGIKVLRLDSALAGWWWALGDRQVLKPADGRRLVLLEHAGEWDLVLVDDGVPVLARGLGVPVEPIDIARDVTLSLLSAELDGGSQPLRETVVISALPPDEQLAEALAGAGGAPVRHVSTAALGSPALGVARRATESATLDLIPALWRQREQAGALRRRFLRGMVAAAALWLVLAAGLLLLPWFLQALIVRQEAAVSADLSSFRQVADIRDRVRLIRSYMDRSQSLLEVLRAVTTAQPEGVELVSVAYRREDGAKLAGEATEAALVYAFKDRLDSAGLFARSTLTGPTRDVARKRDRFEIDARFGVVAGGAEP